ncbi:MAG TPA: hypothetical protein VFU98_10360 [Microlunatus sp.]|nr:hypothetical protein [Microlunatus sp.]
MTTDRAGRVERRLTTPRAAAVAGLLFGLLFALVIVLLRTSLPELGEGSVVELPAGPDRLVVAAWLMPLAGIAFLWFLGVIRDRLGDFEDRFFSSVMFGSGLVFLAMIFVAMALAAGIRMMTTGAIDPSERAVAVFGRQVMVQVSSVYALRMAGVFMISLGTIWFRTGLMPRWLAAVTYLVALALLLVVNLSMWITLLFPAWVCLVSVVILVSSSRRAGGPTPG